MGRKTEGRAWKSWVKKHAGKTSRTKKAGGATLKTKKTAKPKPKPKKTVKKKPAAKTIKKKKPAAKTVKKKPAPQVEKTVMRKAKASSVADLVDARIQSDEFLQKVDQLIRSNVVNFAGTLVTHKDVNAAVHRELIARYDPDAVRKQIVDEASSQIDERLETMDERIAKIVREQPRSIDQDELTRTVDSLREGTLQDIKNTVESEVSKILESDKLKDTIDQRASEKAAEAIEMVENVALGGASESAANMIEAAPETPVLRDIVAEEVKKSVAEHFDSEELKKRMDASVDERSRMFSYSIEQDADKIRDIVADEIKKIPPPKAPEAPAAAPAPAPAFDESKVTEIVQSALRTFLTSPEFQTAVRSMASDVIRDALAGSEAPTRRGRYNRKEMRRA